MGGWDRNGRGCGMTDRLLLEALDLCARKVLEDEPTLGVNFPYVTTPSGA